MTQKMSLLVACARGEYTFLKKYVEKNRERIKYQIYDNHSWGPLHHAVVSNSVDCIQLLLTSNLVDIRWRSYEGQTCLYVAVDRAVSCSIIRLLLETDPELYNIPDNENYYPIHKAISRNSLEIVQTMIETLKGINGFVIKDQFDWEDENSLILAARQKNFEMVKYILENVKCDVQHTNDNNLDAASIALLPGDQQHENVSFEIFKILIPLTYNLNLENSIQKLVQPLVFASFFNNRQPYLWLMELFYVVNSNEHHHLVQRALDSFRNADFDYRLILIGIHSKVSQYLVRQDDQLKNEILYRNIIFDLKNIFKHNRTLFEDIFHVLKPKLHLESLKYSIMKFIPSTNLDETDTVTDLVHMFDIMCIGDLIDINQLLFFTPSTSFLNNVFLLFMPFSIVDTADVYIQQCTKERPPTLLACFEEDLGLARFCVGGNFRIKNSLKSLCRQVIRSKILENYTNGIHPKSVYIAIKSLALPNPIMNYLLFNYTDYKIE